MFRITVSLSDAYPDERPVDNEQKQQCASRDRGCIGGHAFVPTVR